MAPSHTDLQILFPATLGYVLEESTNRNEENRSHEGHTAFHNGIDFDLNVEGLQGTAELSGHSSEAFPSFSLDPVNEVYPRSSETWDDNNGTAFYLAWIGDSRMLTTH